MEEEGKEAIVVVIGEAVVVEVIVRTRYVQGQSNSSRSVSTCTREQQRNTSWTCPAESQQETDDRLKRGD